jgi:hypothetical protein
MSAGQSYRNPSNDLRSLTHRGNEVAYNGNANLDRSSNQTGVLSRILAWTCPEKFQRIDWVGRRHPMKFRPRDVETLTGTTNDDTVVTLTNNIIPVAGERDLDDQPYSVCRAYNVTQGTEIDVVDVDYAANEVTLGSDPADGDNVKLYPIVTEGTVILKGYDQFGHQIGVNERWRTPLETFHSMDQRDPDTAVHLGGEVHFQPSETLSVEVETPRTIVWEDADYPGSYVSTLSLDAEVSV